MPEKVRKRPRVGDVVEIETPRGLAYAQYTHKHPTWGPLIRVLSGLHPKRPADFADSVEAEERFSVFFPLGAAAARGIVTIVANEPVPERKRPFPLFRGGNESPTTGRVETWWLWDGEREWRIGKLRPEHRDLPIWQAWNDTMLIQRIVEDWRPRDEV